MLFRRKVPLRRVVEGIQREILNIHNRMTKHHDKYFILEDKFNKLQEAMDRVVTSDDERIRAMEYKIGVNYDLQQHDADMFREANQKLLSIIDSPERFNDLKKLGKRIDDVRKRHDDEIKELQDQIHTLESTPGDRRDTLDKISEWVYLCDAREWWVKLIKNLLQEGGYHE